VLHVLTTPDPATWGADAITVPRGGCNVRVIHWPTGRYVIAFGTDLDDCYRRAVAQLRRDLDERIRP
jgi:hypothetical protein